MKIRNLYTIIPAQAGIQTLILMFKDWYGFKTLDSRLRGNDGVGIAILICYKSRFQTTFYHIYSDSVSANSSAAF